MRGLAQWLVGAAMVLVITATHAADADAAERLDGLWMDSHGEVILKIGRCGSARCGRVAWLKKPRGPDGGPLRDFRNSDPKLQRRFVCGLTVVSGFKKKTDGTWGGGTVYVPDLGMSFNGYAEVLSPTRVKVTGYVLLPLFGNSEVWRRVAYQVPTCSEQAQMIATGSWVDDLSKWKPAPQAAPTRKPAKPMASR